MLKPVKSQLIKVIEGRFVVIASQYNSRYVDGMLRAAKATLRRAGVQQPQVVRVPGAYEIPVVAVRLARQIAEARAASTAPPSPRAILCLGVILRGETVHAAHIGEAVSRALMEIQVRYEVPIVHEVLLLENEDQARRRCLGTTHNRGAEAAQTALAMARLMQEL